jgi:hypothetical protein
MQENRRFGPAQQPSKPDLAPGRCQEISAPHDEIHAVPLVVHRHRKLVG